MTMLKGKGDVMSHGSYRGVKLLEQAIKIVEKVLETQMQTLISLNKMLFRFRSGKEIVNPIFVVWRMQAEYQKKLYVCFC